MSDISNYQKRAWANKVKHNFNLTDINLEFNYLYGEVGEAFDAWYKKKDDLGSELADIAIYLFGLSEMLGFDLDKEIQKKMDINERRVYKKVDGKDIKILED
jgi:NTP pyrophosphatase (non-canonical NTP hydrolase)